MERQVEALLRGEQFKRLLESHVRRVREQYGLKRMEIEVLYYLRHSAERNTAKDITLSLHMNKGHISQTTDSLSKKKLISASKDANDYRVIHYMITEDANCVAKEIDTAIDRLYKALFEGISAEDKEALKRIASQMAYNISTILRD